MRVVPAPLADAAAFMRRRGFAPARYSSPEVFLMTAAGDSVCFLEDGDTRVLFVLRHDAKAATTFLRAAVKEGPGDAMALAYDAVARGLLFVYPTVTTDVPLEKLQTKLTGYTNGVAANGQPTVTWRADLSPPGASDV